MLIRVSLVRRRHFAFKVQNFEFSQNCNFEFSNDFSSKQFLGLQTPKRANVIGQKSEIDASKIGNAILNGSDYYISPRESQIGMDQDAARSFVSKQLEKVHF